MTDYHVVSSNDELSLRNGSAVLQVARQLQQAAAPRASYIVGRVDRVDDLPGAMGALHPTSSRSRLDGVLEIASKYSRGRPFAEHQRCDLVDARTGDVVLAHNRPWDSRWLRRSFPGAQLVLYVHNQMMARVPSRSIRQALTQFDLVVCVSDFIRLDLIRRSRATGSLLDRIVTVRNCAPGRAGSVPVDMRPVDVTYVGRIVREKGVGDLLTAAEKSEGWTLRLVGGHGFLPSESATRFESSVAARMERLGARAQWVGPVAPEAIPGFMAGSRVVAIPSRWDDPMPLTLLEALESSAAVIATRSGGMSEVGSSGGIEFVPKGDTRALSEAIEGLLRDDGRRRLIAQAGQAEARSRTWADAYAELRTALE